MNPFKTTINLRPLLKKGFLRFYNMKTQKRNYAFIIVMVITVGLGCSPPKTLVNTNSLSEISVKNYQEVNGYKGYALRPVLNGEDSWEAFKEKALFSIMYNELRILELRSYLKKYYRTDDLFYKIELRGLIEKNQSMKLRIETFHPEKESLGNFKATFTHDMNLLVQELTDFTVYH